MRQIVLSLLVDNNPGVLARVAALVSRRGYNIDSITAGVTADQRYSRMTVVCRGDELILEQITKQVEDLPEEQREQAAQEALDILRAKKEIQEKDAEIDREGKIAGVFCKAYEKAVLLDPTEENVRIWAKCTRMTRDEMEDTVKESRELAEVFRTIADLMERLLPERGTL